MTTDNGGSRHRGDVGDSEERAWGSTGAEASPTREPLGRGDLDAMRRLLDLVRDEVGHDVSHYKLATVSRRTERRMQIRRLARLPAYVDYVARHPEEARLLFEDLLIPVTSFFRDLEAWQALEGALRRMVTDRPNTAGFRVWVPGCSTGEEAYSIAIVVHEVLTALDSDTPVEIFATDLSARAIERARAGIYPPEIARDVSAERLDRFFTPDDDGYRVRRSLREMVVFAPHNLIADAPFTRLQLLACRNVLIYLEPGLQRQLLRLLGYALEPGGLLFLGTAESTGGSKLFGAVSDTWNVFRRVDTSFGISVPELPSLRSRPRRAPQPRADAPHDITIEELQAVNERLICANEELETSREEMRSLNEELRTVNGELRTKIAQLSRTSDDMNSLLNGADIAIVFLDAELRIRRYTERAKRIFRLIPSDVGRPIADLAPRLKYDGLVADLEDALRTSMRVEREVAAEDGTSLLMRVLPHRMSDNAIEGLVLSFVDRTEITAVQRERERLLRSLKNAGVSVCGQDRRLGLVWGSGHVFGTDGGDLVGKTDHELFAVADAARLEGLKRQVLASRKPLRRRLEVDVDGEGIVHDIYVEPQLDIEGNVDTLSTVMIAR